MSRLARGAVFIGLALAAAGCGGGSRTATPTETLTVAQPPIETSAPPPPTTTPPPPARRMLWEEAGAFVWHETDVSPEVLGQELRDDGFGWVAVFLHDGLTVDPIEGDWVARFRRASGLLVGGWGALRTQPIEEARLASSLVARYGLDFYIADAEAEYGYSGTDGPDQARFMRSRRFVAAFRELQPLLPAGLSSYCRPDQHDIDWGAWRSGGFAFLPQAYVNDFGAAASPATCVRAAQPYFPPAAVHPTIGMYPGVVSRSPQAGAYARLLEQAGTAGFSVYLAETRMTPEEWSALGLAIARRGIAQRS